MMSENNVQKLLSITKNLLNIQLHSIKMLGMLYDELSKLEESFANNVQENQCDQTIQNIPIYNQTETFQARNTLTSSSYQISHFDPMIQSTLLKSNESYISEPANLELSSSQISPTLLQDQSSFSIQTCHLYRSGSEDVSQQLINPITSVEKFDEENQRLYCICKRPTSGRMIACRGRSCHIKLFHVVCLNMETIPQPPWYCSDCSDT